MQGGAYGYTDKCLRWVVCIRWVRVAVMLCDFYACCNLVCSLVAGEVVVACGKVHVTECYSF